MEILTRKKGDMNFWLVMLVIALIFMVIVFFVMNSVFQEWGKSTGGIQKNVSDQLKTQDIFEGITSGDDEKSSTKTTTDSK